MNYWKGFSLFFLAVHVQTGRGAKNDKWSHYEGDPTMEPGYEKPAPVKIEHGHATHHAAQHRQQSDLSQQDMPFPPEKSLLMKGPKTLNPEVKHIQGQHYSRKLNDRMYDEQNMPPVDEKLRPVQLAFSH
jgi:hypothetical protein